MLRIFLGLTAIAAMTSSVAAETPVKTKVKADDSQKMVCKSDVETGSLVAKRKVCKTKADWDREMLRMRDSMTPTQSCRGSDAGTLC